MEKKNSLIADFTEGPLTKQLIVYALPLMLGNLLHTLYTLVDMAIVGQFCGSSGLSAVSTSGQALMLLYGLGVALGVGGQILVAQQVGKKDVDGISTTIGTSFSLTVLVSVAIAVLFVALRKPLLLAMNTPTEAWDDAVEYMFWCGIGVPFNCICASMSSVLRGLGDSKHPTVFMAVSAAVNIVLDYLLVAVLGMEAGGAAVATTVSQFVSCVCCVMLILKNREDLGLRLDSDSLRIDAQTARTILKLAAPLTIQTASINVSMMFVNAWVNAYGVTASAVAGIGGKLYSLNSIVSGAMMTATATFTGQNIAAGKHDRLSATMRTAVLLGMAYWVLSTLVCLFFPKAVFSIFSRDQQVLAMAPDYMKIMIIMYLGFALIAPCNGFLNGIGNVKLGLIIALIDGVVARIAFSLLFARVLGMGLYGYWIGGSLAGFVTVIWGWIYYFTGRWKSRELLVK